jgi:hypothetical protein
MSKHFYNDLLPLLLDRPLDTAILQSGCDQDDALCPLRTQASYQELVCATKSVRIVISDFSYVSAFTTICFLSYSTGHSTGRFFRTAVITTMHSAPSAHRSSSD